MPGTKNDDPLTVETAEALRNFMARGGDVTKLVRDLLDPARNHPEIWNGMQHLAECWIASLSQVPPVFGEDPRCRDTYHVAQTAQRALPQIFDPAGYQRAWIHFWRKEDR